MSSARSTPLSVIECVPLSVRFTNIPSVRYHKLNSNSAFDIFNICSKSVSVIPG